MKLRKFGLKFLPVAIISFVMARCGYSTEPEPNALKNRQVKAVINRYIGPRMDSATAWQFLDLKYAKNFETVLTDSVIINLAAQIMARDIYLEKYSNFLQDRNYADDDLTFSQLDSLAYESLKMESAENGFDLELISLIHGQRSELYDKIRLLSGEVTNKQMGEIVDAEMLLSNNKDACKRVKYTFILSPDMQKVTRFYRKDDGTLPEMHKIITDALGDNY